MAYATIKYKINYANGVTNYIRFYINDKDEYFDINNLSEEDIERLVNDHFNSTVYYSCIKIIKVK